MHYWGVERRVLALFSLPVLLLLLLPKAPALCDPGQPPKRPEGPNGAAVPSANTPPQECPASDEVRGGEKGVSKEG